MTTDPRVDSYLAALPDDQRQLLADVRAQVQALAPDATELISYDMPAFMQDFPLDRVRTISAEGR
ncbi:MAG TPA: hypothetical protein VM451_11010 [Candidatus Limnocylindria bacterium]|nr:hypothetical protein [Candidatus Limnocylindria bacterium]